jgi:hypothetical protein
MPLWGKTDVAGSKPKYLSAADKANTFFVSLEEAALATNKAKGITGAGWWLVKEYTDAAGTPRYKTECLVAMGVANAVSGDATDDATVSDVEVTITISAQPTGQDTSSGAATFSVTASASSGAVTYQWQKRVAGATRWTNVVGATSASLALTGQLAANDNDVYRVVLGSDSGAVKVTSNAAVLNFVD